MLKDALSDDVLFLIFIVLYIVICEYVLKMKVFVADGENYRVVNLCIKHATRILLSGK
jgi:hypothetical protein